MQTQFQYRRVRISDPENELRMISELRKFGQPFKAVSRTDYILSSKQCAILKRKKIPYQSVN